MESDHLGICGLRLGIWGCENILKDCFCRCMSTLMQLLTQLDKFPLSKSSVRFSNISHRPSQIEISVLIHMTPQAHKVSL